jgi:hypothetical protein
MFAITCDLTGATGYAGCACPDGHDANQLGHHPNEAVCAWVNQMSGLTGTTATPGPLAQGAFTIVRRPRSALGAYALVIR